MKKHILPISNIILLIILLYNYLVGDLSDNKMGWTIFVLLLLNTFWYWKEFFYKSYEDIKEENRKKFEVKFKKEDEIHIELHKGLILLNPLLPFLIPYFNKRFSRRTFFTSTPHSVILLDFNHK